MTSLLTEDVATPTAWRMSSHVNDMYLRAFAIKRFVLWC